MYTSYYRADSKCSIVSNQRQGYVYFIKYHILQRNQILYINSGEVTNIIRQELNDKQSWALSFIYH